jgi:hypothetical protein
MGRRGDPRDVEPRVGPQTVDAAITAFLRAAEGGLVSNPSGDLYTATELRELRAALSHVDSELGSLDVRAVRRSDVSALLDELRREGLSPRREQAIVDALESLYSYAVDRGLVAASPVGEQPRALREDPPPAVGHPPTPTEAVLAVGTRAAAWASWTIVVAFAVVVLVLVVELV